MRLDVPTMIVSSMIAVVLAVTLTLLVVLATGAEWGQTTRVPDDYEFLKDCYEMNGAFLNSAEDSAEEDRALDALVDSQCWP